MMKSPEQTPVSLDRGAMERVLSRATEIAAQASDAPDGMTEAQLLEIGKEVGLSATALRQALAEERTRVVLAEETGTEARVMGPASVAATRAIAHTPDAILGALEEWMRTEYRLIPKRRFGNRRTWEQRTGVFAEIDRSLRGNEAAVALMKSQEVAVTVSPIGDGRTAVRLDADLANQRRARKGGAIGMAAAGISIGVVPVVLGSVLAPLTMLPLFLVAGALPVVGFAVGAWAYLKGHRQQAERAQLALEQLLDRLEHGLRLPSGGMTGSPMLAETITAMAQGVREVAKAVQDAAATRRGPVR